MNRQYIAISIIALILFSLPAVLAVSQGSSPLDDAVAYIKYLFSRLTTAQIISGSHIQIERISADTIRITVDECGCTTASGPGNVDLYEVNPSPVVIKGFGVPSAPYTGTFSGLSTGIHYRVSLFDWSGIAMDQVDFNLESLTIGTTPTPTPVPTNPTPAATPTFTYTYTSTFTPTSTPTDCPTGYTFDQSSGLCQQNQTLPGFDAVIALTGMTFVAFYILRLKV
jgi:hypothetical protein